ncbi:BlaI/MecI/CopY family transcriptional regulator [Lysobacter niastensis]|uniref:BlaI/MecI/CopY family transcriptional regulator n=1 Tax=Lysobacter niastensis TaxID=380629 RepID=A0ABS0B6E3_9GAMM|nr:BlaI/MecI/CopY family transcriptional regulator [Lysobacter niastensis]MBF6024601.1 BlaI/MecI/CopY family transcriptional regulator [Lysobacter niastensis]
MSRKPAKPPKPTAAELDLLRVIWKLGPSTVKDVHHARLAEVPDLAYANVLRLMQVMHGKGLLIRDESQRSHVYAAAHAQDALQTNLLRDLIQKAFSGSGKDLVLAALSSHVTDKERDEIRQLLKQDAGKGEPR